MQVGKASPLPGILEQKGALLAGIFMNLFWHGGNNKVSLCDFLFSFINEKLFLDHEMTTTIMMTYKELDCKLAKI